MSKEIEIGSMVIVPEFESIHLYAGPCEDGDRVVFELAHRRVFCEPARVAPITAMTRQHEEVAKLHVFKDASRSGTPLAWHGKIPSGPDAGKTIYASTRKELRGRMSRILAIADYHSED